MSRLSPRPAAKKFSPKRYDFIPYASRKDITRDQFGELVGRVVGGSYKNAKRPWENRRVVRDIFEKTGHLDTLKQKTRYKEKDVVQMLKDFRTELKNRRKELGHGPSEQGEFYGRKDKETYQKFIEDTYNRAGRESHEEEQRRDVEVRRIRARRRELQRETLGLTPTGVARKIAGAPDKDRGETRRAGLEQRLEAKRNKSSAGAGSDQTTPINATPSASPSSAGGVHAAPAPFSAHLHIPPRVPDAADLPTAPIPDPQQKPEQTGTNPNDPARTEEPKDDQNEELKPPSSIDENLPL